MNRSGAINRSTQNGHASWKRCLPAFFFRLLNLRHALEVTARVQRRLRQSLARRRAAVAAVSAAAAAAPAAPRAPRRRRDDGSIGGKEAAVVGTEERRSARGGLSMHQFIHGSIHWCV